MTLVSLIIMAFVFLFVGLAIWELIGWWGLVVLLVLLINESLNTFYFQKNKT